MSKKHLDGTSEMVEQWLEELMVSYNLDSFESKNSYTAQVHLRGELFEKLIWWALKSLPDEILVGMDIDANSPHNQEVEELFLSEQNVNGLFQSQGFCINEAHIVNRGNSFSVHHLPEDWTDDIFLQVVALELVGSLTGFIHIPMPQQFLVKLMLMRLKKPRA